MILDIKIMEDSCNNLKMELKVLAKALGYNIWTSYSKTEFEENKKGIIYLWGEYSNLIYETKEERAALRKIVPRDYEFQGIKSKVKLNYIKLPVRVQKIIRENKKCNQNLIKF